MCIMAKSYVLVTGTGTGIQVLPREWIMLQDSRSLFPGTNKKRLARYDMQHGRSIIAKLVDSFISLASFDPRFHEPSRTCGRVVDVTM
jgi:hypothetical protein